MYLDISSLPYVSLYFFKFKVQQHEEVLKQKLAALRQEAVNLAQQKKDFVVAKAKASELNDPQINQASSA